MSLIRSFVGICTLLLKSVYPMQYFLTLTLELALANMAVVSLDSQYDLQKLHYRILKQTNQILLFFGMFNMLVEWNHTLCLWLYHTPHHKNIISVSVTIVELV